MANEYLKRTPTSTGNRRVFTISVWYKKSLDNTTVSNGQQTFIRSGDTLLRFDTNTGEDDKIRFFAENASGTNILNLITSSLYRDNSNWTHILANFNSTQSTDVDRASIYVNGVKLTEFTTSTRPSIDELTEFFISGTDVNLGLGVAGEYFKGQLCDYFVIDGQALTPDVFGFYKDGDGYISAGSTQSTDFRPGQWVPKKPSVIKNSVNNSGGFGVNGFYLPLNDYSNFGADFHCDPNTIITLQDETAAQPKNGAPTTTDSYVSQLRSDPYAANLVLAVPGIIGGQGSGYGDYSADIKGSGSNKTVTANGNAGVAVTASYYGSAMQFDGTGDSFSVPNSSDLQFTSEDFTIEAWFNTNSLSDDQFIFSQWNTANARRSYVLWLDGGSLNFNGSTNGTNSSNGNLDNSISVGATQWNHAAFTREGTTNRLFLNGVCVGINTTTQDFYNNTDDAPRIGGEINGTREFDGYIQDLRVYKGVAKYKNGFDVAKPYVPVGIATWREVPDCTANNFATLNPLHHGSDIAESDGNLSATWSGSGWQQVTGTIGVSTGKWYWESVQTSAGNQMTGIGINEAPVTEHMSDNDDLGLGYYSDNGRIYYNSTNVLYGDTWTQNDIIGVAFNASDRQITFYKNGTSQGTVSGYSIGIRTEGIYHPAYAVNNAGSVAYNFGQNPTFSGNVSVSSTQRNADANGKGQFRYAPPSGFLALCEDNLPTPAIADPGDYFKTVLWTGDGNVGRNITGVGFKPDFVWIKSRSFTNNHHLFDSVRGPNRILRSSTRDSESLPGNIMPSFNDDGFTVGENGGNNATNDDGNTFVAWCWQAGAGTTSLNTDGAINSVVSVNQDAGFSIVSYTGTGSNTTVGHGLTVTPNVVICKNRTDNNSNWSFNGNVAGLDYGTNKMILQQTGGIVSDTNEVTGAGTSILNLGNSSATNDTNDEQIAYCWHSVEGFSKFGSYTGNGNADGPFVYCGFKPSWVMIKRTDAANQWQIQDTSRNSTNPTNVALYAEADSAEEFATSTSKDFLSNGFKIRGVDTMVNADGGSYFFMAFAESPFKTANAK